MLEAVDVPESTLRPHRDRLLISGESLRDDEELRDRVDNWIVRGAQHLVGQYGAEITTIITDTKSSAGTPRRSQPADRTHVGAISSSSRINGTVVGARAGLGD